MAPSSTPQVPPSAALPMAGPAGGPGTERADAARNRRRLLDAARRLVAAEGIDGMTMEAVACAAQVGKGTVFRRFGDRAGLIRALLDDTETALQDRFLTGPPPLGPGADPHDRLVAFGHARLDVVLLHGDLLRAADADDRTRYAHPSRGASATHVAMLLREIGVDGDVPLLAEALLGTLDAGLVVHQHRVLGMPVERLRQGWDDLVARITAPR
ncbi:MAG: TetR/AcrR family transcriptional regulator [Solirubrobacteraceae bacterium]|nr:TetR/AcrR family transcriptional regulator [Solirubrobacteraceae bacterium]